MNKKILFLATLSLLTAQSAMASYQGYTCETYRVSQNVNHNIEKLIIKEGQASLDGQDLEISEGDGSTVIGAKTIKAIDGKGNYMMEAKKMQRIGLLVGNANVGRDHDIEIFGVEIKISRNSKNHTFVGSCVEERISSCGGGCAEQQNDPSDDL